VKLHSLLYSSRFFPNIWVCQNPLKVFEYRHLVALTRFSGSELVLDLGCGSGLQTCCLARMSRKVIGIDIADLSKAQDKARRVAGKLHVEFIQTRLQDAAFERGTFDRIFSFCVIEHIPEYRQVMELCASLLKPGGEFVISVDSLHGVSDELRATHALRHHVHHYFQAEELRSLLSECGFGDVQVHAILRSRLAARLFCRGIRGGFSYTLGETFWRWLCLCVAETLSPKDAPGVFLVARCRA